jgi:transposase-like protein
MRKRVYRYSESFKLKVIDELEKGVYDCPFELSRAYGIGSPSTVPRWVRKYGKGHV